MFGGFVARSATALGVIVSLLVSVAAPAGADPPPRLVSGYEEQSGGKFLHRDGGYSVPLPGTLSGHSLWLFGDTAHVYADGTPVPGGYGSFWPGTWGAVGPSGPGVVPTVSEIPGSPTPLDTAYSGRGPSQVLHNPTGLLWPDGTTACSSQSATQGSFAASWPTGATNGPAGPMTLHNDGSPSPVAIADGAQLVFIGVVETCVIYDKEGAPPSPPLNIDALDSAVWAAWPDMVVQRFKLAAYTPGCVQVAGTQRCNQIVAASTVFSTSGGAALPWKRFLFNPIFSGGSLYLNAWKCDSYFADFGACIQGRVTTARVPVASLHDPLAYQWYQAPDVWGAEATAASVLPSSANGGAILVDTRDFSSIGEGFLMLQQWHFGGGYQLWEAPSPGGPWTLEGSGIIPGCQSGAGKGCYHLLGHPELSSPGHRVYTFADMSDGFIKISTVP